MINRDNITKADFAWLTESQARMIISRFVKNDKLLKELMSFYKERAITGFQLKDMLTENNDCTQLKRAFEQHFYQSYKDPDMYIEKQKESEEDKNERMGYPSVEPNQVLEECGLGEVLPKLEEHKISNELFWELKEEEFEKLLDIKLFAQRRTLFDKMQTILKDHEDSFLNLEEAKNQVCKADIMKMLCN